LKGRCFDVFLERNKRIGTWRKRYNYELYKTFNEPNIVTYIKVKRLVWAEHLVRMNNDRSLKKIFNTKPDGVRSAGRPKLRWEDGVDQYIRILGVKNWKKVALDRDEWAKLLKKASAHKGLSSQR
jgi:cell wall assembly regulator SMI1